MPGRVSMLQDASTCSTDIFERLGMLELWLAGLVFLYTIRQCHSYEVKAIETTHKVMDIIASNMLALLNPSYYTPLFQSFEILKDTV